MVLHISLEGVDGVGKTTQINNLNRFFTKKGYIVRVCRQPSHESIIKILKDYKLLNHQVALLMALDRSLTYYREFWEDYDIVLWDRSVLSSYAYNTDGITTNRFVSDINEFFPDLDLYIVLKTDKLLDSPDFQDKDGDKLIKKYDELISNKKNVVSVDYIENNPDKMFNQITKAIFDNLPKCNWCGRLFRKSRKNKKYCCENCKKYAKEEQNRIHALKYYHNYKHYLPEELGSYGCNLHQHKHDDIEKERILIENEKRRLGI